MLLKPENFEQTLVLLIVFLILLMTSAIAISTEADEAKDEPFSGADFLKSATNGERGFEEPLIVLVPEDDYSSKIGLNSFTILYSSSFRVGSSVIY